MKLLICDVEGTIFQAKYKIDGTDYASTMWQPLAQKLGEGAVEDERETHKKWENKEYDNYLDWVNATVEIHKKYKLNRRVFNDLIDNAEYVDGVVDFFKNLDRGKYIPVLVSGGFQELIRRAQKELGISYGYGACEYFFDDDTEVLKHHSLTPCDFEGKFKFVEYLFGIYKLNSLKDWVFIGDGKNDLDIAKKSPLSFGINAHPKLASIVKYNVESFNDIERYLKEEEKKIHISTSDYIDDITDDVSESYYENIASEISKVKENIRLVNDAIENKENENYLLDELLKESSEENKEKELQIVRLNEIISQHKIELQKLELDLINLSGTRNKEEEKRRKILEDTWNIYLPNFSFDSGPIRDIAKLNYNERLKVEDALKQLHDSQDPRSLSRGKLSNGNDHMGLRLLDGFPARIEYTILKSKSPSIRIVTFYKHNAKYMS